MQRLQSSMGEQESLNRKSSSSARPPTLKASAESNYSIAGGGITDAPLSSLALSQKFSHVSIGGGASITYLSGDAMPGNRGSEKGRSEAEKGLN